MENAAKKTGHTYHRVDHFLGAIGVALQDDLQPFGLSPDCSLCTFLPERLAELRQFCKINPDFHIFSFMPSGIYYNRAMPDADWYGLGNGDANPRLVGKDLEMMGMLARAEIRKAFSEK